MKTTIEAPDTGNNYLYVTSDEHVFFERESALKHANKLRDKSVRSLTRQEAESKALVPDDEQNDENDSDTLLDEFLYNQSF
ncbi:MAG: hypothetical protein KF744_03070 [Taibaiella sp.]|nr:hypothetical protein [Taibaiella sp.]